VDEALTDVGPAGGDGRRRRAWHIVVLALLRTSSSALAWTAASASRLAAPGIRVADRRNARGQGSCRPASRSARSALADATWVRAMMGSQLDQEARRLGRDF